MTQDVAQAQADADGLGVVAVVPDQQRRGAEELVAIGPVIGHPGLVEHPDQGIASCGVSGRRCGEFHHSAAESDLVGRHLPVERVLLARGPAPSRGPARGRLAWTGTRRGAVRTVRRVTARGGSPPPRAWAPSGIRCGFRPVVAAARQGDRARRGQAQRRQHQSDPQSFDHQHAPHRRSCKGSDGRRDRPGERATRDVGRGCRRKRRRNSRSRRRRGQRRRTPGRRRESAPCQRRPQPLAGAVQAALDGPDRAAEPASGLLLRQALQVAEHHRRSIMAGQAGDLLVDCRSQIVPDWKISRRASLGRDRTPQSPARGPARPGSWPWRAARPGR